MTVSTPCTVLYCYQSLFIGITESPFCDELVKSWLHYNCCTLHYCITVQYCTVLLITLQYSTMVQQYCTVLWSRIQQFKSLKFKPSRKIWIIQCWQILEWRQTGIIPWLLEVWLRQKCMYGHWPARHCFGKLYSFGCFHTAVHWKITTFLFYQKVSKPHGSHCCFITLPFSSINMWTQLFE